jgi:hypothetical protein
VKTCTKCGETKAVDEFCMDRSRRDGRSAWCNTCKAARRRSPERRAHDRSSLLRKYGLTPEQWDELLAAQGGRCAICRTDEPGGRGTWHTDHDHACCASGSSCGACVRGLLCQACNIGIGKFQDSPDILRAAIRYLTPKEPTRP